ncbi:NAD(P)-dependent oxidoreductase [Frankia nepalensis]|uniref:NAD(P)-dependent oxidoreductase n=1 Tax=Frankia nepalensis TaxID=1836974 RepID=UPI001932759F|nr:NAD(P)-binding domain-containing protein [Frankia nepalensis]
MTILGLGRMGTALNRALLAAHYQTTVWNRTPSKVDGPVALGAERAETPGAAITASPMTVVCVADYAGVQEVLAAGGTTLRGRTLVNLTTGTPRDARDMAAWVAGRGADYLDGAMMAVPQSVATPSAFFLYSGSQDAFDRHRRALDALATSHYLGHDPAAAELWDLALLDSGYAALAGFLHGLALLDTAAVPPSRFVPLVAQWLRGMTEYMSELAGEIESGDYSAGASPVGMNRAAVMSLIRVSEDLGIDAALLGPLGTLLERGVAQGRGDQSFASLFELLRRVH